VIFTRADVPVIQKLVFTYLKAYYSAAEEIVRSYPQAERIIPKVFLPHPRNVRLIVTPTAFVVYIYEGDEPWVAEWANAGIMEVASGFPGFVQIKRLARKRAQHNLSSSYKADAYPIEGSYPATEGSPEDGQFYVPASGPIDWDRAIVSDTRNMRSWRAEQAREEAQSDILGATLQRFTALQPSRASVEGVEGDHKKAVAHELNRIIEDFEVLLADARQEEAVQTFLKDHPFLLDLRAIAVDPKVPLGSEYVTDFVVTLPGSGYLLVEIERPSHSLYTKSYNPTSALTHAVRQVEDWLEWSYENLSYLRSRYPDIHEPKGLVVLGRRSSLDRKAAKALRRRNVLSKVRVATYDDLIDDMKSIAYNLERGTIPTSA
jgi:Domain of unknown function (DUF4263)